MSEPNWALLLPQLTDSNLALVCAINSAYKEKRINFRLARGFVSQIIAVDRPLRSEEVQEVIYRCERLFEQRFDAAHLHPTGGSGEMRRVIANADTILNMRLLEIEAEKLPHVAVYEPLPGDFAKAAGMGMTWGINYRPHFLEELQEHEVMLAKMGVVLKRVQCGIEDVERQLGHIRGHSHVPADLAAAIEIIAFPRKGADIRRDRGIGAKFVEGP